MSEFVDVLRVCVACGFSKPQAMFRDGRRKCRQCDRPSREANREASRRFRLHNPESVSATRQRFKEVHPGYDAERQRRYRAQHPDRSLASVRAWQKANPESRRMLTRRRRARLKAVEGTFTVAEWEAMKDRYEHACLMCGQREPDILLTPDHVVPLCLGGPNTIDNIQPPCGLCNSRKNGKVLDLRPAVLVA